MCLLECGYQNVYGVGVHYGTHRWTYVTPLELLTMHMRITDTNNNCNDHDYDIYSINDMFADFVYYIITNVNQFGGEKRICNYIIDSNAAQIILNFKENNVILIRQLFVEMAKRNQIDLSREGKPSNKYKNVNV